MKLPPTVYLFIYLFFFLQNNDEKEKKQRQLNRLQQQIQSKTYSPTTVPSDHRKSINLVSGLTCQQLTEHYSKCIQLSTENVSL